MRTIGIIGGKGLIGSFFAKFFKQKGMHVEISDLQTKMTNQKLIQKSDIVIFSVPMHLTVSIIKDVVGVVRREQLLLDVTSIKEPPMREMLKSKGSVIGLHPMFRPGPHGFRGQTIALCHGRASAAQIAMIKSWFTEAGGRVIEMTAKKHDELMSIIQVLLHFHTIVLGHTFRKLKISIPDTLAIASPIYRLEMDMIGRIFSQNAKLYGAIEMLNPQTEKVTKCLIKETQKLFSAVRGKDMDSFEREFTKTAKFLGGFKETALHEINKLLTYLQ